MSIYYLEALIDDIETDKLVAIKSLERPDYKKFASDPSFHPQKL